MTLRGVLTGVNDDDDDVFDGSRGEYFEEHLPDGEWHDDETLGRIQHCVPREPHEYVGTELLCAECKAPRRWWIHMDDGEDPCAPRRVWVEQINDFGMRSVEHDFVFRYRLGGNQHPIGAVCDRCQRLWDMRLVVSEDRDYYGDLARS